MKLDPIKQIYQLDWKNNKICIEYELVLENMLVKQIN